MYRYICSKGSLNSIWGPMICAIPKTAITSLTNCVLKRFRAQLLINDLLKLQLLFFVEKM